MSIKDATAVYAGEQLQAAGVLAFSSDGNALVVYRSANVTDGCCWCGVGGKIEHGETPEEAARREFMEEAGIHPPEILIPALVYETPKLKFTNYIGVLKGQPFPRLNWESDGYAWAKLHALPAPFHYGLTALLDSEEFKAALSQLNSQGN